MARRGITAEQVADTADSLLQAGERPTIERIRAQLGSGSPNTINRHLDAWWAELGGRLQEKTAKLALPQAPETVVAAASTLWTEALSCALREVQANQARKEVEFEKRFEAIKTREEAVEESRQAAQRAVEGARAEANQANSRLVEVQKLAESQAQDLARLRSEKDLADQERQASLTRIEKLALELDQARLEAVAFRDETAQHVRALEDRAHAEVDRARQERKESMARAKQLERELAAAQNTLTSRSADMNRVLERLEKELVAQRARADSAYTQLSKALTSIDRLAKPNATKKSIKSRQPRDRRVAKPS